MTHKLSGIQQGILFERVRNGMSYRKAAAHFGVSPNTAKAVFLSIRDTGTVTRQRGSGRPKQWTKRESRLCKRLIYTGEAQTAVELKRILAKSYNKVLNVQCIRRILHSHGIKGRIRIKKPLLSKRHKKLRLKFAQKYKSWTKREWSKVLFSDETKINRMGSDGKQYVWRRVGEPLTDRTVKPTVKGGGGSIMIWGCMGVKGVGHGTKVTGTVNAELYKEILKDEMMRSPPWCLNDEDQEDFVFQQDNAPCHKAKSVMEWFEEKGIVLLDYPPQSPDLNPIENLWRILKIKIHNNYDINTLDQLWQVYEKEWEAIDPKICEKLIESMPRRLAAVIKARGGHTKY